MLGHPPTRIGFVARLDLSPVETLPFTKIDLAQIWACSTFDSECAGDRFCCRSRPPQIASVDAANVFRAKSVDQLCCLFMAACIQIWIGVAAKPSGHICLRVANE